MPTWLGQAQAVLDVIDYAARTGHPGPVPDGWVSREIPLDSGWFLPEQARGTGISLGRTMPRNIEQTATTAALTARRETVTTASGTWAYTDADMYGYGHVLPEHFVISIDAKMPTEPGLLPCPLWVRRFDHAAAQGHQMYGLWSSKCPPAPDGEIDAVETWAHRWDSNGGKSAPHFQGALHLDYKGGSSAYTAPWSWPNDVDPGGWHTWTITKTPGLIRVYVDGDRYASWSVTDPKIGTRLGEVETGDWYPRITLQVGKRNSDGSIAYEPAPDWQSSTMKVRNLRVAVPAAVDDF